MKNIGVDQCFRLKLRVLRAHCFEVVADINEPIHVEPGLIVGSFEHFDERLGGVVPWPEGHGGNGGVNNIRTCFNGLHEGDHRDAGGGVAVDVDLRIFAVGVLDATNDVVGGLRFEQRGHVLERDRIRAHIQQTPC